MIKLFKNTCYLSFWQAQGDIFYTDDVVEVLNLSDNQIYDIRSQTCNVKRNLNKDIVGMRYKLKVQVIDTRDGFEMHCTLEGWNHGGHSAHIVEPSQIRLNYRPLKNWIKHLYFKKTGKYAI